MLNEERHDQKYFVYDIVYACYTDQVHVNSFLEDMNNFIKWKNENGYTIDHADSNHRNNTVLNLSMMNRRLNSSKNDLIAKFVDPFAIMTAYCSGKYRIEFRTRVNIEMIENLTIHIPGFGTLSPRAIGESAMRFICKDAVCYVACLHWLYDTRIQWCDPENTPRMNQQQNCDSNYWAGDIKNSLKSQKMLAQMDSSLFDVFKMKCA